MLSARRKMKEEGDANRGNEVNKCRGKEENEEEEEEARTEDTNAARLLIRAGLTALCVLETSADGAAFRARL